MLSEVSNGKELCESIKPEEAVACGAAVQVATFDGEASEKTQNLLLLDFAPFSLGIETADGSMTPMIKRSTAIPTKMTQTFSTHAGRPGVYIMYEGERTQTRDCYKFGTFKLSGIPPALRGVLQIEVTIEINANEIMNVSTKDKGSERANHILVTKENGRLLEEDVEKMAAEAKKLEAEDGEVRAGV